LASTQIERKKKKTLISRLSLETQCLEMGDVFLELVIQEYQVGTRNSLFCSFEEDMIVL
jgi:hypothetical protein